MSDPVTVPLNVAPMAAFDPTGYILAALMLAACAVLAWRRGRFLPAPGSRCRWARVAISSLSFAASLTLVIFLPTSGSFGFSIVFVLLVMMFGFFMIGIVAFLLVAMIEIATGRAHASRSRGWLIAAPAIFALAFILPLVIVTVGFGPGPGEVLTWDLLQLLALSIGAGLVWWSYLPVVPAEVAPLFE